MNKKIEYLFRCFMCGHYFLEYLQFVESLDHPNNSGLANPEAFLEELDVKEKEAKSKSCTVNFN